jgi:hypothetical protein
MYLNIYIYMLFQFYVIVEPEILLKEKNVFVKREKKWWPILK